MIKHIVKYKNYYHFLLSCIILIAVTSVLLWRNATEIDGYTSTMVLAIVPCLFFAGVSEGIQQSLSLGTATIKGTAKNSAALVIGLILCWIFKADNIFELLQML